MELGDGDDAVAEVSPGERLEVVVTSPGTSGHLWQMDVPDGRSRLVSRTVAADASKFGSSGSVSFVVEPPTSGESELRLRLQAPWEPLPARDHVVTVRVREG